MPFKSEKQRKWMYANEPEMAKKWEKEEAIKEKLRNFIKQEIKSIKKEDNIKFSKEEMAQLHNDGQIEKDGHTIEFDESINEGFEKYHLGGLLDSRLKKRLERAIKIWGGKIDAVGDDYIKFRLGSFEVKKFPALLKKLDRNKNVWIGDKRKNNIWDRRQKINKLEATTSVSVPGYLTPVAFKKSTQTAIDIDDEDENGSVGEAMTMAPFSSQEAKAHINSDIKDMSKHLGKASQQVIKIMMDGVRKGKYTAMDISRGIKEGPVGRTHFGEMTFIQSLWSKMREKFRRYSKDRKLS